jgi:hypothetical protein
MRAKVDKQCVIHANAQFWEQMLAMTLVPLPTPAEFSVAAGHLLGSGQARRRVAGAHRGAPDRRLGLPGNGGNDDAAAGDSRRDRRLDATKEIANMIAGVIKSSLPRPCIMTVPESGVQTERFRAPAQTEDSLAVAFHHASGDLMVRVCEKECL